MKTSDRPWEKLLVSGPEPTPTTLAPRPNLKRTSKSKSLLKARPPPRAEAQDEVEEETISAPAYGNLRFNPKDKPGEYIIVCLSRNEKI